MIKSKFGPITNPRTGQSKDIVINALSKESLTDIKIYKAYYGKIMAQLVEHHLNW